MAPPSISPLPSICDVLVVGTGNAACCTALSAIDSSPTAHVVMIDCAPPTEPGGNTYYTAGSMRTTFGSFEKDLCSLPLRNVTPDMVERIEMDAYSGEDFLADLKKVSGGQGDEAMARVLVQDSWPGMQWLAKRVGVRFRLPFERQAYEVSAPGTAEGEKRWRCWGGLYVNTVDGGKGLVEDELRAVSEAGVEVRWETRAEGLVIEEGEVKGLVVTTRDGERRTIHARGGVVLACGGYESSKEMRGELMGEEWEGAYVRGTPHNDGTALRLTTPVHALRKGQFGDGACHSTCWDAHAPLQRGDPLLTNQYTKSGYPLEIFIDSSGRRFVDEGEAFRNYTYAKMGREILKRPDRLAVQIWDWRTMQLLRGEEYGDAVCRNKVQAGTLEELAEKLTKVHIDGDRRALRDPAALLDEVRKYNEAIYAARGGEGMDVAAGFDPSILDGLVAPSPPLAIPKSNWALPLDQPPFLAVVVSTGITFTFGGLHVDVQTGQVQRKSSSEGEETETEGIPGLYAAGEAVGGLFYNNYPGGSGLTAGLVWGRRAGRAAAEAAASAAPKED